MWTLLCALAFAGADDEIEVARTKLMMGMAEEARAQAKEVLAGEPTSAMALDLYVAASADLGLGTLAVAESRSFSVEPPGWAGEADRLRALVREQNDTALMAADGMWSSYPEHPELLVGLWDDAASKRVQKGRRAYLGLPEGSSVAYALRKHQLHLAVGYQDQATEAAVAAVGPLPPPFLDDVGLRERGRKVAVGEAQVTGRNHDERVAVARRAHGVFLDSGKPAEAAAMWRALSGPVADLTVAAHLVEASVAAGVPSGVTLDVVAQPTHHDRSLRDTDRLRQEVATLMVQLAAQLLATPSEAAESTTRTTRAWSYLVAAAALSEEAPPGKLDDAGKASVRGQVAPTGEAALKAVSSAGNAAALHNAVDDALWAVSSGAAKASRVAGQGELYRSAFADVWVAAAQAARDLNQSDDVLVYGVLAAAAGATHDDLPLWLGQEFANASHRHAAFAWFAEARAHGHDVDGVLATNFDGLGDPLTAATALAGEPGSKKAEVLATGPRRGPAAPRGSSPGVKAGQGAPVWSLTTERGTLSSATLQGKVVVLTFWKADCGPCLDQLPAIGSLTRRLRSSGRDVVMVAVSIDEDDGSYEDVYRIGQRWGELGRDPALAEVFGLRRVPSTWVIDRHGQITYFVDHRVSAEELEAVLLQAAM